MDHHPMPRRSLQIVGVAAIIVTATTGCATRGFVRNEVSALRQDMDTRTEQLEAETAEVRNSAEMALRRAELAFGKAEGSEQMALGHVAYEELSRQSVSFAFDSDVLDDQGRAVLDAVAEMIQARPDVIVDVYGFTDPTGSASYNQVLGQRRADSVVRYLATRTPGPIGRYAAISFGESLPAGETRDLLDRGAQQRRVMVSLFERVPPPEVDQTTQESDGNQFN